MKITWTNFLGTAPKYHPEQLRDGYAVTSLNTRPGRQILEPWRAPDNHNNGSLPSNNIQSIYKYNNEWFSWNDQGVTAKRIPIANDPFDYVAIADPNSYPQITNNTIAESGAGPFPNLTYRLGVPQPETPVVVAAPNPDWIEPTPVPTEDDFDIYETSYVLAFVDAWGRVGPASTPSERVAIREYEFENTTEVTLTLPTDVVSGLIASDATRGTAAKLYIYRANYAANGQGVYQFVDEVDYGTAEYKDTVPNGDLLEAIATDNWVGPPDDDSALFPNGPLRNLVIVGSDFMAGHNDRLVCFSEPGTSHAWPTDYYEVFSEKVISISPAGSNLVVLTDGAPYVLSGVSPSSMSRTKLADVVPCASPRAVTEVDDAVYFANQNGMFIIRGYVNENVTRNFMTESEWRSLNPTNMIFANYDSRVLIACPSVSKTLMFDPTNPNDGLREIQINPQAGTQLESSNDFAFIEQGTHQIVVFDSHPSDYMPLNYVSKVYQFNEPLCFTSAKVRANTYPVDVTFYCRKLDSSEVSFTKTVVDDRFFYLPFDARCRHWWLGCTSNGGVERPEIRQVELAESPKELT